MSKLDPYDAQVRSAVAAGANNQQIADSLQVDEASVRRYRRKHGLVSPIVVAPERPSPMVNEFEVSEADVLRAELKEATARLRRQQRGDVARERALQAIEGAAERLVVVERPPVRDVSRFPDQEPHHRQVALLSDWHCGEMVDPDQVGGLNEFNYEVLERRVRQTAEALLSFQRVRPALTGLELWFLGDNVSGIIHDELAITNEFPVAEQAFAAGELIAWLIGELAPHYPAIYVLGIAGNHARTTKEHASKNVFDSWDTVAYHLARAATQHLSNVEWEIPRSGTAVRTVAGRNILLSHGDGIRSSMPGVPWGGVMRRWNELVKQYAEIGTRLDGWATGHYHQANVIQRRLFCNGSLIGTSEHGYKNYGGGETPAQLLLTWDEKRERLTDVSYITPS